MKALIVSDSHGRNNNLINVINKVEPIDLLIHLGDFDEDSDAIRHLVECPSHIVCGNNDYYCDEEYDKLLNIGDYKVFLSHGHRYGVNYDVSRIKDIGKELGAKVVMFGHTHRPHIDVAGDIWSINPGSISLPRQSNRMASYIIMEIDNSGLAHFTLKYLDKSVRRFF